MRNSKLYRCQMFHVITCHFLLLLRMASRLLDLHHPTEQGPLLWTERGRVSQAQTLKLNAAKMRRNSTSFSCLRFTNSELFRNFAECVLPCSTINNQSVWTDSEAFLATSTHFTKSIIKSPCFSLNKGQLCFLLSFCLCFLNINIWPCSFQQVYISKSSPAALPSPPEPANSNPRCPQIGQW